MGLLSIFKRKTEAVPSVTAASPLPGGVEQARTRARQRLVGAVVLLVIGIIAFPLLFESQPRPIPVDIPIDIPRKDGAPALVMPSARSTGPAASAVVEPAAPVAADVKPDKGAAPVPDIAPAASASAPPQPAEPVAVPKPPAPKPATPEPVDPAKKPAPAPTAAATPAPAPAADAARAKALLEGKAPASKEGARFVVQVGAFAEAAAALETRAKVDKLGLKSYTQLTETPTGNRVRVRVGPFATREEAERALAKTKAAGVNGVVLTL